MKKHVALFSSVLMMSTTLLGAGSVFAASQSTNASPESAETPVQAVLELPENGGTNPTPPTPPTNPSEPDPENPGNKPNNPEGSFGIAYQPDIFNFGTTTLNESGNQEINALMPKDGDHKFHIGVKDKTRETKGWSLTAKLSGDITSQKGITISLGNTTGDVQVNRGDSSNSNLVAAPAGSVTGVANVEIGTQSQQIMAGSEGYIHNDVYDYATGQVKMKISDTKNIQAGNYSGNVDWNLAVVPGK